MSKIRVLVVDDSAFMRRCLTGILESDSSLVVAGIARNGEEAIERVLELEPDVVTLDITMPRMDGLTALTRIMMERPTPVVVISSLSQEGASVTLEALELGAIDFVPKPSGTVSLNIASQTAEIVEKVRGAARARVGRRRSSATLRRQAGVGTRVEPRAVPARASRVQTLGRSTDRSTTVRATIARGASPSAVIAIGVSTGGPQTLLEILPLLPPDLAAPVVIVQHMPPSFTASFARRLDAECQVHVKEAEHGESLLAGTAYVAPGGYQMTVTKAVTGPGLKASLSDRPRGLTFCPSVEVLFDSVAQVCGSSAVGVMLTGMGDDGADGMVKIRAAGGATIAESEETAVVFGMPRMAIERGGAGVIVPAYQVAGSIERALRERLR